MRKEAVLAAVMVLGAGAVAPVVATDHGEIRPGMVAQTPLGQCTLSFVFEDAAGDVYFSIAGHCVNQGNSVSSNQVDDFGEVVLDDDGDREDFALIDVHDEFEDNVVAEVEGHPGTPTGYTTPAETTIGDVVHFSGYGVGFQQTEATRENRSGILKADDDQEYCVEGPVIFGDSGGPVVHGPSGQALGIVSRLGAFCGTWLIGPTVQNLIETAASDGFDLTLRTA